MQITKEQALQFIQENQSGESPYYASEIRILSLESGTLPEFYRFHDEQVRLQTECWVCEYEQRDRHSNGSVWSVWGEWEKRRCYVVVPEPNPFVVVAE